MPAINTISADKLARLVGTPAAPFIVQLAASEGLIPCARRFEASAVADWASALAVPSAVVACSEGGSVGAGVAAWLRQRGIRGETLEGGVSAWRAAGLPLIDECRLPQRDREGRTVWVTRARPKVDRIACPWLIRRFVDPGAVFLFVAPSEVEPVAERFGGAPFDVEGVFFSHRGPLCTFDIMVETLGLAGFPALLRLAEIVRGADTARPDIAPQAAGLLAASLGLSRMFADDLGQLDAGMLLYDAFYRWCRDAADETHDWVSHQPHSVRRPAEKAGGRQ